MHERSLLSLSLSLLLLPSALAPLAAAPAAVKGETVECDLLIVGGGLAGAAAAYEGLRAARTVCLTDITDWVGGQISSQGNSALDEAKTQRSLLLFPEGYRRLRQNIQRYYGKLNPGECWVSESCFLPADGDKLLMQQLEDVRLAHGFSYPAQIPLRALIPQKIDNLIVAGKGIATSHIAASAYRVHTFEWSVGAAAGTVAAFALERHILPYQLVHDLSRRKPELQSLQYRLERNGNPIAFPNSYNLNFNWDEWQVW